MTGIPSWARKGVKVVCVDAAWSSDPPANPLENMATYTVSRAFIHEAYGGFPDEPFIELVEVEHPFIPGYGFQTNRFRPLAEDSEHDGIEAQNYRKHQLHLPLSKWLEVV